MAKAHICFQLPLTTPSTRSSSHHPHPHRCSREVAWSSRCFHLRATETPLALFVLNQIPPAPLIGTMLLCGVACQKLSATAPTRCHLNTPSLPGDTYHPITWRGGQIGLQLCACFVWSPPPHPTTPHNTLFTPDRLVLSSPPLFRELTRCPHQRLLTCACTEDEDTGGFGDGGEEEEGG
jgi:hypothetical protein